MTYYTPRHLKQLMGKPFIDGFPKDKELQYYNYLVYDKLVKFKGYHFVRTFCTHAKFLLSDQHKLFEISKYQIKLTEVPMGYYFLNDIVYTTKIGRSDTIDPVPIPKVNS